MKESNTQDQTDFLQLIKHFNEFKRDGIIATGSSSESGHLDDSKKIDDRTSSSKTEFTSSGDSEGNLIKN